MQRKNTATLFQSTFLTYAFAFLLALGGGMEAAAQTAAGYAGRPFLRIIQSNTSDPAAGFITGFGRAQLVGDEVVLIPQNGLDSLGVFSGRGGPLTKIVSRGETVSGILFTNIYTGFARDTGEGSVAIVSGETGAPALQLIGEGTATTLLAPGAILPNSGGETANVIGEPYLAGGNVAVIAWHALGSGSGVNFRGVYRVVNHALEPVADSATELPGIGVPDGFSSQVGFDGQTLAFWASKGPFTENEGMFVQTGSGGEVIKIARNGDALPGGGVIDGFISPPYVSEGAVYFFAFEEGSKTTLLKYEDATLTVLASDGDSTPNGELQNLGQFGLAVEDGKVFFPARTPSGAALFSVENGTLATIIPPGSNMGGIVPQSIVLQDVAGDTLVLEVTSGITRRLVANLAQPAPPIIVKNLENLSVAPGTRVELSVEALGDAPLTFAWKKNGQAIAGVAGDTLVIESAGAEDVASYRVDISNAFDTAFSATILLNVEVAPIIVADPPSLEIEEGDPLLLSVVTGGGFPQSYYWKKDGAEVISDSTGLGLFYRATTRPSDAGHYSVVVSNAWGQATSGEATVTIKPAAPNPTYAGRRFVTILDKDTVVPGTGTKFDTTNLSEPSVRWSGSKIIFTGQNAANEPLGVFSWENGTLTRLLAPNAELPNSLGIATGYQLVWTHPEDPIVLRATQMLNGFPAPVGIYQIIDGNLEMLVDITMDAPETLRKFANFYGEAWHAAGKLLFNEIIDGIPTIFRADNGTLSRILRADQDLPVVGTAAKFLQSLSYNGSSFLINAVTSAQQQIAVLHVNSAGEATKVAAKGDTIPGSTGTIRSFGLAGNDGTAFYLNVYDSSFAQNVLSYEDGTLARALAPGMEVAGLGTIQSLETSYPQGSAGKAYSAARVLTSTATLQGIIAGNGAGVEPVLFTTKLDARRVNSLQVCGVRGDQIIVLALFTDGTRGYYVNSGAVEEALELAFTRGDGDTILFTVPEGATLEAADTFDAATWEPVASPEVSIGAGNRFFRLRK